MKEHLYTHKICLHFKLLTVAIFLKCEANYILAKSTVFNKFGYYCNTVDFLGFAMYMAMDVTHVASYIYMWYVTIVYM